jgi:hypothetical protein
VTFEDDPRPRREGLARGRAACADAAWELLTTDNVLARLGLGATSIHEQTKRKPPEIPESTAGYHLSTGNVIHDIARKLVDKMAKSGEENSADYKNLTELIPALDGGNLTQIARQARRLIGRALQLDLSDSHFDERFWYALQTPSPERDVRCGVVL